MHHSISQKTRKTIEHINIRTLWIKHSHTSSTRSIYAKGAIRRWRASGLTLQYVWESG